MHGNLTDEAYVIINLGGPPAVELVRRLVDENNTLRCQLNESTTGVYWSAGDEDD